MLRNRKSTINGHILSGPERRGHTTSSRGDDELQQAETQQSLKCLEFKIALFLLSVYLRLHFLVAAVVWDKYFVKTLQ